MCLLGGTSTETFKPTQKRVCEANKIRVKWTGTTSQPIKGCHWPAGADKRWECGSVKGTAEWYCVFL